MSNPTGAPPTEAVNAELLDKDSTTNPAEAERVATTGVDVPVNGEISSATEDGNSRAPANVEPKDTHMSDAPPSDQPESLALQSATSGAATASSVATANSSSNPRVGTPSRNTTTGTGLEGERTTSRAASVNPEPASSFVMPSEAAAHGAPTRQYINSKITNVLLEGMKIVARDQPQDPLRVLGEYLLQRSKELEVPATEES